MSLIVDGSSSVGRRSLSLFAAKRERLQNAGWLSVALFCVLREKIALRSWALLSETTDSSRSQPTDRAARCWQRAQKFGKKRERETPTGKMRRAPCNGAEKQSAPLWGALIPPTAGDVVGPLAERLKKSPNVFRLSVMD